MTGKSCLILTSYTPLDFSTTASFSHTWSIGPNPTRTDSLYCSAAQCPLI